LKVDSGSKVTSQNANRLAIPSLGPRMGMHSHTRDEKAGKHLQRCVYCNSSVEIDHIRIMMIRMGAFDQVRVEEGKEDL